MRLATALVIAALFVAAQPTLAATEAQQAQQDKMKTCNADATTQKLSGDDRKAFMKTCLSGKQLTPQQQKMSDCSKNAASQSLKGDARKKFMSECLKNK